MGGVGNRAAVSERGSGGKREARSGKKKKIVYAISQSQCSVLNKNTPTQPKNKTRSNKYQKIKTNEKKREK
jgi:hypothetical protein